MTTNPTTKARKSELFDLGQKLEADARYQAMPPLWRHALKTAVVKHADRHGSFFLKLKTWSEATGVGVRTLKYLTAAGEQSRLFVSRRTGRYNVYLLNPSLLPTEEAKAEGLRLVQEEGSRRIKRMKRRLEAALAELREGHELPLGEASVAPRSNLEDL